MIKKLYRVTDNLNTDKETYFAASSWIEVINEISEAVHSDTFKNGFNLELVSETIHILNRAITAQRK